MVNLFAGLDVSTQSCKLVVIDVDAGAVLHADRVDYDRDLQEYGTLEGVIRGQREGVSESDPRMWTDAVDLILGRAGEVGVPMERVRCISVSGQQHGLVALTKDGRLARPRSKLWNDFSTAEECQLLTEAAGGREAMVDEVGNSQRPGYTAPKILHLRRHEPESYARAHTLFLVHNYINWHLTGGPNGGVAAMEPGDASGMALWHPGTRRWSRKVLDAIDPGLSEKLPPILPSDRTIGALSPSMAARFGLASGCRVDAGSGDNMYGAVGTGNFEKGIVTVSLGTSGTAYTFMEEPFIDPTGEIASFCDSTGHYLPLICVSNMANGYKSLRSRFGLSHEEFDRLVEMSPPGNGGRVVVPWYEGERTPDLPDAAPLYFGFGVGELQPDFLSRAVLEGHILNLYDGFSRLPVNPNEIRVTGGLATSTAWCQTIADIFEAETVPVLGEGAALGAAIHAAWVWHREEGEERPLAGIAAPFVVLDENQRRRPDPAGQTANRLLRRLYRALNRRVRGLEGEDPFLIRKELVATTGYPHGEGPA
jgi:xylulokinase